MTHVQLSSVMGLIDLMICTHLSFISRVHLEEFKKTPNARVPLDEVDLIYGSL